MVADNSYKPAFPAGVLALIAPLCAALTLVAWLLAPAAAQAASLTWSSVDYATMPAAENVLGQGLFQGEQSTNVKIIIPDAVSCPSVTQCTAFGTGGTAANENGAVATFDPSPLKEGPRAAIDATNGAGFTGAC